MPDWIKGKQLNPYQRPRIDWLRTLAPFVPFWLVVFVVAGVCYLVLR